MEFQKHFQILPASLYKTSHRVDKYHFGIPNEFVLSSDGEMWRCVPRRLRVASSSRRSESNGAFISSQVSRFFSTRSVPNCYYILRK